MAFFSKMFFIWFFKNIFHSMYGKYYIIPLQWRRRITAGCRFFINSVILSIRNLLI